MLIPGLMNFRGVDLGCWSSIFANTRTTRPNLGAKMHQQIFRESPERLLGTFGGRGGRRRGAWSARKNPTRNRRRASEAFGLYRHRSFVGVVPVGFSGLSTPFILVPSGIYLCTLFSNLAPARRKSRPLFEAQFRRARTYHPYTEYFDEFISGFECAQFL